MTFVATSIAEVRAAVDDWRGQKDIIGLVPTMGALHAGHGALIDAARRECQRVVVSVFVNPTQFNQRQDFDLYPRALSSDIEFCQQRGADLVFAPSVSAMYPHAMRAFVEVERLTDHLCGKFRPGHFRGVTTVVAKLFHIVEPHRAYFGRKDAQQRAVIRRMVADLHFPVEIEGIETVREPDGLALSSRNQRLGPQERSVAPALYRALCRAAEMIRSGVSDPEGIRRAAIAGLTRLPEFRIEYFEIVDPEDLQPMAEVKTPALVAAAAWLGQTRLIDNVLVLTPRPGL